MSAETHVRWATLDDIPQLTSIGPAHLAEPMLRRKIAWQEIAVAVHNECIQGVLHLDLLWSAVPFIALIWVAEEQRSRGIGTALLRFVEASARAAGQAQLYSSSQLDEAAPQAWHRRMGFQECGILAGHNDGIGEVFFRKRLAPVVPE